MFKGVFNFFKPIISRQYATSAPQRRSLILVAFSILCALGILGLLFLDSLDLDFDFSVPVLDSKNTEVLHPKDQTEDVCKFDYSAIDIAWEKNNPHISFIVDNELVIGDKKIALESIFFGKQICIIVMIPDSIIRENDFSNKNIYIRASSENVFRVIPVFSIPKYENFCQGIGFFNYPGNYSLNLTIELPGRKDITTISESTLSLSLSDEALRKGLNETLPICNATSEITGQWISGSFYDLLRPLTRYSNYLDIDNDHIFIPDQCKLKLVTPIEQLLCLENQTIHAYGDEFLWGSLFGIENGYQKIWCDERSDPICSCNFPASSSLIKDIPFANISSLMFGSSLYFHPIKDLLETSQEWKVALEQISKNEQIPKADVVVISVSNSIFINSSALLRDFKTKLTGLLSNINNNYPNSAIFVRTPEPFALSQHIPNISRIRYSQVRDVTLNITKEIGVYLWDVGILDGRDWNIPEYCVNKKSTKQLWFRKDVVKLESQLLFHSLSCSD